MMVEYCASCGHTKEGHIYHQGACRIEGLPCDCKQYVSEYTFRKTRRVVQTELDVLKECYRLCLKRDLEGVAGRVLTPAIKQLEYFLLLMEEESDEGKK